MQRDPRYDILFEPMEIGRSRSLTSSIRLPNAMHGAQ